nr:unnamed protein product [Spirometra erinaceieuropaei]
MNARKDDSNDTQTGQSAPAPDVPSRAAHKDASEISAAEPSLRSDVTMVKANEPNTQSKNSAANPIPSSFKPYDGSKDFKCWLRRLKFHLDDVPQDERSRTVLQHLADDQMGKALDAGLTRHTPFRRQQNNTSWPRPHYQPSQRFNRPPPLNAEPRQFRGDRDSTEAAITKEGNHIIPVCFDYT